jgi:hypothetical protein
MRGYNTVYYFTPGTSKHGRGGVLHEKGSALNGAENGRNSAGMRARNSAGICRNRA